MVQKNGGRNTQVEWSYVHDFQAMILRIQSPKTYRSFLSMIHELRLFHTSVRIIRTTRVHKHFQWDCQTLADMKKIRTWFYLCECTANSVDKDKTNSVDKKFSLKVPLCIRSFGPALAR